MFTPRYHNEQTDLLMDALLQLKTSEEAYRFLEDVLTVQELKSITQRLEVAVMLRPKDNLSGNRHPRARASTRHHQPASTGPCNTGRTATPWCWTGLKHNRSED